MIEWWAACATAGDPLRGTFDGRDAARGHVEVELRPRIRGTPEPTDVIPVPGHPDRAVVLSKSGTAWLATLAPGGDGAVAEWFRVAVRTESELGLLSLAFAPDFATSGAFVVHANPADGRMRSELRRGHVDPATLSGPTLGEVLLEVDQPHSNHDGGQLLFGPDGMLYVGLGDGGGAGDPDGNGQNTATLLGKILRLEVPASGPARAAPGNPLAARSSARPEIWAWGLRNPWRFTFDPSGRLVVADVGQDRWEEIDLVARGDNLGWDSMEGRECYGADRCDRSSVPPIHVYGRDEGVSVTGGVVVTAPGPLAGRYLFGDFGTGRLWALGLPARVEPVHDILALGRFDLHPSTFARGPDGAAWVADYTSGTIYELVPR